MGATFPNGIASFSTKRNLLDDVDANDINKLQDEVRAIEESMGEELLLIQQVEQSVSVLQDEITANDAADQALVLQFNSLKDLIMALWEGKNIYVASASGSNLKVKNTKKDRPYPPGLLTLHAPGVADDPMGMWNGTGFTLKKDGFWIIEGLVDFNLASIGPRNNNNFGTYEASVTLNAQNWLRGTDRQYPEVDGTWHDVVLQPRIAAWLPAGTKVTLRAAQSSDLDQRVGQAHLSVYRVRGRA